MIKSIALHVCIALLIPPLLCTYQYVLSLENDNLLNNYAVIVSTSRYWFNYRHTINALSFYHYLKEVGNYPDDHIILMLADDFSSNPRNVLFNKLFPHTHSSTFSLYNASSIEVDYYGDDVNVEQVLQVLQGKSLDKNMPVLDQTNEYTRLFIYLTGHGGDQFLKFHDVDELMGADLAHAIKYMHEQGKYGEILFIADTCQAFTLGNKITSPNVYVIGSSLKGESSYAHHSNSEVGLAVIERYTHAVMRNLGMLTTTELTQKSLQQALVDPYSYAEQRAHIGAKAINSQRGLDNVTLDEFFVYHPSKQSKFESSKGVKVGNQNQTWSLLSFLSGLDDEGLALYSDTEHLVQTHNNTNALDADSSQNFSITPHKTSNDFFLGCLFGTIGLVMVTFHWL